MRGHQAFVFFFFVFFVSLLFFFLSITLIPLALPLALGNKNEFFSFRSLFLVEQSGSLSSAHCLPVNCLFQIVMTW